MSEEPEENTQETESEEETKRKQRFAKSYGLPEWLIDTEFPSINPEVAEALGIEQQEIPRVVPDRIYIKTLIRRVNAMKILKFFLERDDAFYLREIAEGVGVNIVTARTNLKILEKAGLILAKQYRNIDKLTLYFTLINKNVAELVMKQYLWHVGFQLGRYIPYDKIKEEELREDQRFIEKCKYFGLSLDEGIETVTKCPKIDSEHKSNILYLWRKEPQGYIPPEEELEEEAIEVEVPEEFTPP